MFLRSSVSNKNCVLVYDSANRFDILFWFEGTKHLVFPILVTWHKEVPNRLLIFVQSKRR